MEKFKAYRLSEVEKKINEFKAVEAWLGMQLGMLQMTIKTMEMQKASLDALQAQAKATAQASSSSASGSSSASSGGKGRK